MQQLSRKINCKNINYDFTMKDSGSINFTGYNGPFTLVKKIRDGHIPLEMANEDQKNLKEN